MSNQSNIVVLEGKPNGRSFATPLGNTADSTADSTGGSEGSSEGGSEGGDGPCGGTAADAVVACVSSVRLVFVCGPFAPDCPVEGLSLFNLLVAKVLAPSLPRSFFCLV